MNSEWFESVVKDQIKTCEDVLIDKAKEYSDDFDRLHNFKNAAGMMGCDAKEALSGMMAKHTISIYDMCRSGKDYPIELWNEKITDHINYLLLLRAVVTEEKAFRRTPMLNTNEDVQKPKFDPEDLNKAIENVRKRIENCSSGNCVTCPHSILNGSGIRCGKGFLDEYDNLIARLKEVPHEST